MLKDGFSQTDGRHRQKSFYFHPLLSFFKLINNVFLNRIVLEVLRQNIWYLSRRQAQRCLLDDNTVGWNVLFNRDIVFHDCTALVFGKQHLSVNPLRRVHIRCHTHPTSIVLCRSGNVSTKIISMDLFRLYTL